MRVLGTIFLAVLLLLAACGPTTAPESPLPTPGTQESPLATPAADGPVETLRMALLPVLDVLPFHVAQQNGYFDQAGVKVELIPVKSAQ